MDLGKVPVRLPIPWALIVRSTSSEAVCIGCMQPRCMVEWKFIPLSSTGARSSRTCQNVKHVGETANMWGALAADVMECVPASYACGQGSNTVIADAGTSSSTASGSEGCVNMEGRSNSSSCNRDEGPGDDDNPDSGGSWGGLPWKPVFPSSPTTATATAFDGDLPSRALLMILLTIGGVEMNPGPFQPVRQLCGKWAESVLRTSWTQQIPAVANAICRATVYSDEESAAKPSFASAHMLAGSLPDAQPRRSPRNLTMGLCPGSQASPPFPQASAVPHSPCTAMVIVPAQASSEHAGLDVNTSWPSFPAMEAAVLAYAHEWNFHVSRTRTWNFKPGTVPEHLNDHEGCPDGGREKQVPQRGKWQCGHGSQVDKDGDASSSCGYILNYAYAPTCKAYRITKHNLHHNHQLRGRVQVDGKVFVTRQKELSAQEHEYIKQHACLGSDVGQLKHGFEAMFPGRHCSEVLFNRLYTQWKGDTVGIDPDSIQKLFHLGMDLRANGGVFGFKLDENRRIQRMHFMRKSMSSYARIYGDFVQLDGTANCNAFGMQLMIWLGVDCLGRSFMLGHAFHPSEKSDYIIEAMEDFGWVRSTSTTEGSTVPHLTSVRRLAYGPTVNTSCEAGPSNAVPSRPPSTSDFIQAAQCEVPDLPSSSPRFKRKHGNMVASLGEKWHPHSTLMTDGGACFPLVANTFGMDHVLCVDHYKDLALRHSTALPSAEEKVAFIKGWSKCLFTDYPNEGALDLALKDLLTAAGTSTAATNAVKRMVADKLSVCRFHTCKVFTCGHVATQRVEGYNSKIKRGDRNNTLRTATFYDTTKLVFTLQENAGREACHELVTCIQEKREWSQFVKKKWDEEFQLMDGLHANIVSEDDNCWHISVFPSNRPASSHAVFVPKGSETHPTCSCPYYTSILIPCRHICVACVFVGKSRQAADLPPRWLIRYHPWYGTALSTMGIEPAKESVAPSLVVPRAGDGGGDQRNGGHGDDVGSGSRDNAGKQDVGDEDNKWMVTSEEYHAVAVPLKNIKQAMRQKVTQAGDELAALVDGDVDTFKYALAGLIKWTKIVKKRKADKTTPAPIVHVSGVGDVRPLPKTLGTLGRPCKDMAAAMNVFTSVDK
eukprot:jgi/Mesvir1/8614/Mv04946-RA.1